MKRLAMIALLASAASAQRSTQVVPLGATIPVSSTVAALPACSSASNGSVFLVTNALAPTLGLAVAGGGAATILVRCNGTSWLVGQ